MRKPSPDPEIVRKIHTLYSNIKRLREQNGLTIPQMAKIIGISDTTLMKIESCAGTNHLYAIHLQKICKHFKISADALFEK